MSNGKATPRKHRGLKEPWQKGQSGNPAGRPKGSRNKLGEAFVADLYADWIEHGIEAVQKVRQDRPHDYLKVIASILPKDLHVKVSEFDEMSDADLVARIRQLHGIVRPFLDENDEPRNSTEGERPG
jgi:hypothetical protein